MQLKIGSPDNSRIKLVRKLQTRKGRVTEGKFAAEGINLLREAVSCDLDIDFILVSDDFDGGDMADYIRKASESDDMLVCEVSSGIFNKLTDAGHGVGVITVVRKPETDLSLLEQLPDGSNILVLDRIQDPGNIGTMIRTAAAADYSLVLAVKGTADIYSAKVLRATAGMVFRMPFIYVDDAETLAGILSSCGKRIVITVPAGGKPYYEEDLSHDIALVIGNEGNGVSQEVIDLADVRVTLPMKGGIESLNAAVAAAILMYEAVRR